LFQQSFRFYAVDWEGLEFEHVEEQYYYLAHALLVLWRLAILRSLNLVVKPTSLFLLKRLQACLMGKSWPFRESVQLILYGDRSS
jgi:hypothetical protein